MDRLPIDLLQPSNLLNIPVRAHHALPSSNVLLAAWRRRGLICGLMLLFLAGAAAALGVMKRQYAAESVVQFNLDKREAAQADDRGPSVVLDAASIVQGELRLIRSRLLARRVVERLHLADDAPAPASPGRGMAAWVEAHAGGAPAFLAGTWRTAADGAGRWLGRAATPENGADPGAQRIAASEDEVMSHMAAEADNRSYLITIKYLSSNPERAAQIANALAEEYIQRRLETNFEAAGRTAEWLDAQVAQVKRALTQAQGLVDAYQAQSGLLELGTSENLGQQQLRDLSGQLSTATTARNDAQARLVRVQEAVRGGVPSADDMKGLPQVRTLLERTAEARARLGTVLSSLGPQHPLVLQAKATLAAQEGALATELRRAVAITEGELAAAQRTERDVSRRRDAMQQLMIAGKGQAADLSSRQAAAQALRDRLAALTRSRDQVQAVQQLRPVAASLIVPAETPRAPASPKPAVVIPASLAGGLALGVLMATLFERRDRGFQTGSDVEPALGKRCLGMVPDVPRALSCVGRSRRAAFEASFLAESARSVGAALGLFDFTRNCRVVLVTSAVEREGKSVFCQALAEVLAASGRRVLLVDGSPRRMGADVAAHRDDEAGGGDAGAAFDAPAGGQTGTGLTVIRRSAPKSVAVDVFSTPEFGRMLEETRKRFDVVVLEGPPVLLVSDSVVLGRLADTVVQVARWSHTRRKTVSAALTRLHESSVVVDGVVLTRVNFARHAALKAASLGSSFKEKRFYEQLTELQSSLAASPRDHRT